MQIMFPEGAVETQKQSQSRGNSWSSSGL